MSAASYCPGSAGETPNAAQFLQKAAIVLFRTIFRPYRTQKVYSIRRNASTPKRRRLGGQKIRHCLAEKPKFKHNYTGREAPISLIDAEKPKFKHNYTGREAPSRRNPYE